MEEGEVWGGQGTRLQLPVQAAVTKIQSRVPLLHREWIHGLGKKSINPSFYMFKYLISAIECKLILLGMEQNILKGVSKAGGEEMGYDLQTVDAHCTPTNHGIL